MHEKRINYVCILDLSKNFAKVDFGEIKCGIISDRIMNSEITSEICPHLISPKSTFCKIFTQIKYTNMVYSLLIHFLKFQFDILFTKKISQVQKNKYNKPRNRGR